MIDNTLRIRAAAASVRLSAFIVRMADSTTAATGVHAFPTADAPDTWEKLQEVGANLNLGYLPVWNGASESTIYTDADTNIAFRFWHDMGHLDHDCDFTPGGEVTLQVKYHLPIVAAEFGWQSLETLLYAADTIGQIEYNVEFGEFPTNQLEFALAYVANPSEALTRKF